MIKRLLVAVLVFGLGSAAALAGDIVQDARDIARDAADIARDTVSIQADRTQLQNDLAAVAALRVERSVAEQSLAQAVQAGDLVAAQALVAKVETLTASIRQQERSVAGLHKEITLDRLDRALDRAELHLEVRELTRDFSVHPERNPAEVSNSQIASDRAALEAAIASMESSIKARRQALQAMAAAVTAGDLAAAQADLASAESLKAAIKAEAKAVADASAALAKAKAAAKAAAKAEKAAAGSKGKK